MKVVLQIGSPSRSLYPFDLNLVYDDYSWSCLPGYFQDSEGTFEFDSDRGLDLLDEERDNIVAQLRSFRKLGDLTVGMMGEGIARGGLFGVTRITWTVKAGVSTTIRHVFGELRRKIIEQEDLKRNWVGKPKW